MQKVELSGEMTSKPTRTQHFARNEAMDDAFSMGVDLIFTMVSTTYRHTIAGM